MGLEQHFERRYVALADGRKNRLIRSLHEKGLLSVQDRILVPFNKET
ncbi:hypothetical protein C943_01460 [Mariniradius saccharolyticus AK6]|uniref:Uncharacterized protein n=1 Tax=Mariniradius saccharolyticus AK6 TaxID=1239962 RepID=M7XC48_9BACT|nr:hypothetical protein C943_01460 [Mariniradius saccharolyticus AK6]